MSNFFNSYDLFTRGTEPPRSFQFLCSVGAISAMLGRKVVVQMGPLNFYPNLYIVLVGMPATRKSTALYVARDLIKDTGKINFASTSLSKEALLDSLAAEAAKVSFTHGSKQMAYNQVACFASELSEFLGGKHLNDSIIRFMTDLWDAPSYTERTRKHAEIKVEAPYFTMIGCCTKDWITTSLASNIITDGFARRVIFHYDDQVLDFAWPVMTLAQCDQREEALQHLNRIFTLKGFIKITKPAFDIYCAFYSSCRASISKQHINMQNYFSSKHALLLKFCVCISAGYRNDLVIDSACIKAGLKIMEAMETTRGGVFSNIGRNETITTAGAIKKFLEGQTKKAASKKTLLKFFLAAFKDIREFDLTISGMVQQGELHQTMDAQNLQNPDFRLLESSSTTQGSDPFEEVRFLVPLEEPLAEFEVQGLRGIESAPAAQLLSASEGVHSLGDAPAVSLRRGGVRLPSSMFRADS